VQAIVVAGTEAAGFLIERTQESVNLKAVAHVRPDGAAEDIRSAALEAFAQIVKPCVEALKDGALLIEGPEGESEQQFCLVTLLRNDADIVAVSAVITRARDVERAQQRLVSMQLVAGYFDMYMLKRSSEAARTTALSHQNVLQMATAAATGTGFKHSATALCNELQSRTGALRVCLGWLKGYDIRLKAISHTEQFDKKQELVTMLELHGASSFIPGRGSEGSSRRRTISRLQCGLSAGRVVCSAPTQVFSESCLEDDCTREGQEPKL
jgi:hypothetical protein